MFFTGDSQTLGSGDKLVLGQQGEVVGPAKLENYKGIDVGLPSRRWSVTTKGNGGKGVSVLFPGNKRNVSCWAAEVHRRAATAAKPRLRPTHARRGAHAACVPAVFPRRPLPRGAAAHVYGCGTDGGRGRGAGWPLRWQRQ